MLSEEYFKDFEDTIIGRFDSIASDLADMRETIIEVLLTAIKNLEARVIKLETGERCFATIWPPK